MVVVSNVGNVDGNCVAVASGDVAVLAVLVTRAF